MLASQRPQEAGWYDQEHAERYSAVVKCWQALPPGGASSASHLLARDDKTHAVLLTCLLASALRKPVGMTRNTLNRLARCDTMREMSQVM